MNQIEMTKHLAREANKLGDFAFVQRCIEWLDANWHDDRAAMAFYTELETNAPLYVITQDH